MTDGNQSNDGQPREQQVNLQQVAQQFMAGLQRHFDMLAFNLAARESVQEALYDKYAHLPKIMPAANRHQNFEQMQAYARDLLLRQVLGDCLNLAATGMNNAHFFLGLIKATQGSSQVSAEVQQAVQKAQQSFVIAPVDEKFNRLEKEFGIMCELEDSIISMGFCLQALMQQGGIVKAAQLDESGELVLDLKVLKVLARGQEEGKAQAKLVDQRKVFREDEAVDFSDLELQLILVTVAAFADALFKSVSGYALSFKQDGA